MLLFKAGTGLEMWSLVYTTELPTWGLLISRVQFYRGYLRSQGQRERVWRKATGKAKLVRALFIKLPSTALPDACLISAFRC